MSNYSQAHAVGAVQELVSASCLLITNLNPKFMYAKQNNYTMSFFFTDMCANAQMT